MSRRLLLQDSLARPARAASLARSELFAGLLLLGFISGATDRIVTSVQVRGFAEAIANTFDVSAIVWGACWFAFTLALSKDAKPLRRMDYVTATAMVAAFLVPVSAVNWMALTALSLYLALTSEHRSPLQRGAWVFLAITFTMFWSPRIFSLFSDWILAADAELVSWITGTQRIGNTVQLRDGQGFLWIAPACSSMANVSLAILCWITFAQFSDPPVSWRDVGWCVLTCVCVVAFNVTRIGLIGFYPTQYQAIHGPIGTLIAGYITLLGIVGLCLLWKRRELFAAS
jgi:hypothetical protein